MQNAEDAGAREVKFLYDRRTYGTNPRYLHHQGLSKHQVCMSLMCHLYGTNPHYIYHQGLSIHKVCVCVCPHHHGLPVKAQGVFANDRSFLQKLDSCMLINASGVTLSSSRSMCILCHNLSSGGMQSHHAISFLMVHQNYVFNFDMLGSLSCACHSDKVPVEVGCVLQMAAYKVISFSRYIYSLKLF